MKAVYEANDPIEGNLFKNLLEQHGIQCFIHGEALQGGVGELTAFGYIRLMVHENDYFNTRKIIDDWNQGSF